MKTCPCCSSRDFNDCCEPYLLEKKKPQTVKQLMRSRYCAYALGNYGEYLLNTWHPSTVQNVRLADLSLPKYDWKGLEIIDCQQQADIGRVEFKATFADHGGPDQVHHETSAFYRVEGKWLYLDGKILDGAIKDAN